MSGVFVLILKLVLYFEFKTTAIVFNFILATIKVRIQLNSIIIDFNLLCLFMLFRFTISTIFVTKSKNIDVILVSDK